MSDKTFSWMVVSSVSFSIICLPLLSTAQVSLEGGGRFREIREGGSSTLQLIPPPIKDLRQQIAELQRYELEDVALAYRNQSIEEAKLASKYASLYDSCK